MFFLYVLSQTVHLLFIHTKKPKLLDSLLTLQSFVLCNQFVWRKPLFRLSLVYDVLLSVRHIYRRLRLKIAIPSAEPTTRKRLFSPVSKRGTLLKVNFLDTLFHVKLKQLRLEICLKRQQFDSSNTWHDITDFVDHFWRIHLEWTSRTVFIIGPTPFELIHPIKMGFNAWVDVSLTSNTALIYLWILPFK